MSFYDLDFQSQASCGHDPHSSKFSWFKREWKQADEWSLPIALPLLLPRSVKMTNKGRNSCYSMYE